MTTIFESLSFLDGAKILEYVCLAELTSTGKTAHYIEGSVVEKFDYLAIAQYEDDEEVYPFYCDGNGEVINDGFYTTVESAKQQASFEFEGIENRWIKK